jgi:hypothetical protein
MMTEARKLGSGAPLSASIKSNSKGLSMELEPLDYAGREEPRRVKPAEKVSILAIALYVVAFIIVAILVLAFAAQLNHDRFQEKTRSRNIVGKTPSQVISILGPAGSDQPIKDSRGGADRKMDYFNGFLGAQQCCIGFRHGIAVGVQYYENGSPLENP